MAQPPWDSTDDAIEGFGYSASALQWDQPVIDGIPLPGIWTVSVRLNRDIEKKKQKGKMGAAITDQGDNPSEVRIEGQVYNASSWEQWQEFLPKLATKRQGNERAPMVIEHPMTAAHGIVNIYVEDIESQKDAKSDVMRVNIKAIEWTPRPKEPVLKKAPAKKSDAEIERDFANATMAAQETVNRILAEQRPTANILDKYSR